MSIDPKKNEEINDAELDDVSGGCLPISSSQLENAKTKNDATDSTGESTNPARRIEEI